MNSGRTAAEIADSEWAGLGQTAADLVRGEAFYGSEVRGERIARGGRPDYAFGKNLHLGLGDERDFHGELTDLREDAVEPDRGGKYEHSAVESLGYSARGIAQIELFGACNCDGCSG